MHIIIILLVILFVGYIIFSNKQGNAAIKALEHGGNFKCDSFLHVGLDSALAFDDARDRVGFIRFDVTHFSASGAPMGQMKNTFYCDLADIEAVKIRSVKEEPGRSSVTFMLLAEIPKGNIWKHVSITGTLDSDMVLQLKKHMPKLPYQQG